MPRTIWTGTISFGLVSVRVGLYSATQQQDVSFHQFERGTDERVRYKRVAEGTDREVDYSDVVKGYEVSGGEYVMLTKNELEEAEPGRSRTIEIEDFVELSEVDPIYYEKTYYLGPAEDESRRAYALLRDAMAKAGLAGVAAFVMRGKEYLAVVRPWKRVLVLETLFFADEVRDPQDVLDKLPAATKSDSRELRTAVDLIQQLKTSWEPERYHDTYRERLLDLIRQKAAGEEVHAEQPERGDDNVIDLMDALQRSIEQARDGRSRTSSAGKRSGTKSKSGSSKATKSTKSTGSTKSTRSTKSSSSKSSASTSAGSESTGAKSTGKKSKTAKSSKPSGRKQSTSSSSRTSSKRTASKRTSSKRTPSKRSA